MTLSDYSQLKHQVLSVANKDSRSDLLKSLKELFRDGINSIRRFEQIKTIQQLLHVLELRDLLSEDNVSPLKDIARELGSQTLMRKIDDYMENHEPREHLNYYTSEKTEIGYHSKKDRIYLIITEQIGSAWRDLARSLKIQECVIDGIDSKYSTLATKASVMLKHFDQRADRINWHFTLCDALDKIRRKDLRRSVQEVMMMNM